MLLAPANPKVVASRGTQRGLLVRPSTASAASWDRFAQDCDASFRCAFWASRAWQFETHWVHRLTRWELFARADGIERKVGQCAVGIGRQRRVFSDGLQLLSGVDWSEAMAAVLARTGRGRYVYGSDWSTEPPRQGPLAAIDGVRVGEVRPTLVQVVDLRRWPTIDDYEKAVSGNVRRNVKKAQKTYRTLRITTKHGPPRVRNFWRSVAMRRDLFRRKGVRRSTAGMVLRSAVRLLSLEHYSRYAFLQADGDLVASYAGIDFGATFCYLEGASDAAGHGASWYLLMAMIRHAFEASGGRGRFVMGSDDGTQHGDPAWDGLRRSREQCCATPVPTSVVQFTYDAASPA